MEQPEIVEAIKDLERKQDRVIGQLQSMLAIRSQDFEEALEKIATLETQLSAEREAVRVLQTKILRWSTADLRVSEAESKTYIGRGILALMNDIRTQAEFIARAAVEKAGKQ